MLVAVLALVGTGLFLHSRSGDSPAPTAAAPSATPTRPAATPSPTKAATPPQRSPRKTPYVVLISVDGLNPTAITQLDARGKVPAFHLLMAEGAFTLNARTSYEQTNTLPNHTGMLTGRPILGPTGTHVTFNAEHPGTLKTLNGHDVPGVFDPVHAAGLETGFYAEKAKFDFLVRSWTDALTVAEVDERPDKVLGDALARLRNDPPALTFLHLRAPDDAGHGDKVNGFMGPKYLDAVTTADHQVGEVLDAIRTSPTLAGRTTVILTADHGGRGTDASSTLGHRNPTLLDNYRIPFLVWGPGVPADQDLYALNPGRKDPGDARVAYDGRQPIRNLDATNLVLRLFGLDALPDTRPHGLTPLRDQ